jgi:uncharacterized protein
VQGMANFVDRVGRPSAKILDNGMLDAPARLARVGVQVYHKADGTPFRVLRTTEEVFAPEALAGYTLAPITDDHPAEFVTADNAKSLMVGTVAQAERAGDFVTANIRLTDKAAIDKLKLGKVQLSAGYTATVTPAPEGSLWTDSSGKSHAYDAMQSNIRINHVALVDAGRAGPEVRVVTDSEIFVCADAVDAPVEVPPPTPRKTMEKIVLDGATIEVEAAVKLAVESAFAKIAGELDAVKSKLSSAEKQLDSANDPKRIADAVKARVALEAAASKFLKDAVSDKSDREIRVAVLAALAPTVVCDNKSDEYVSAAFDTVTATAKPVDHAAQKVKDALTKDGADAPALSLADLAKKYNTFPRPGAK